MIWRSRTRWVMRVGETYWVIDPVGAVIARCEPSRYKQIADMYFVDHYVRNGELIEHTARGGRWSRFADHVVLEKGLRENRTESARQFLESIVDVVPIVRPVLDHLVAHEELLARLGIGVYDDVDHGDDFRRAREALFARAESDELCTRMLRTMGPLGRKHPGAAALTAFARACLLLCKEDDPPAIDEESIPVTSPLAEQVAELAELLDNANGDAADAMHTCALLLGYRVAK